MNFDIGAITPSLGFLMQGLRYSVQLTLVATAVGIGFGTLLALARLSPLRWLNLAAAAPRGKTKKSPAPTAPSETGSHSPLLMGVQVGAERSAYLTFAIFESAYFCEIIRAGIQSIGRGQVSAGLAMGFTYGQNMRYVILPQAFRNVVPLLLMQVIILFQDTSLVYVVGATDLLGAASKVANRDNSLVEMYVAVAVIYFVISFVLSRLVKRLHSRIAIVR